MGLQVGWSVDRQHRGDRSGFPLALQAPDSDGQLDGLAGGALDQAPIPSSHDPWPPVAAPALPACLQCPVAAGFFHTIRGTAKEPAPVVMLLGLGQHLLGPTLGRPCLGPGGLGPTPRLESRRQPGAGAPGLPLSSRCCDRSGGAVRFGGLVAFAARPYCRFVWCCNGYAANAGATGGGHGCTGVP